MSEPPIATGPVAAPGERPERTRSTPRRTNSSALTAFFMLLLGAGVVVLGWLTWQQHVALDAMRATLTMANAEISELHQETEESQSTLSETSKETGDALNKWESEIRKLWDVSNKRNKDWIETNRADIKDNATSSESLRQSVESLRKSIQDNERTLITATRQLRDLADKLNTTVAQVTRAAGNVEHIAQENKRAIDAIDASRSQNNARLLDLQRRVNNLEN